MSKWINVNDKLPKDESTVLVAVEREHFMHDGRMMQDVFLSKYFVDMWVDCMCFGIPLAECRVTHWMLIPELPEFIIK